MKTFLFVFVFPAFCFLQSVIAETETIGSVMWEFSKKTETLQNYMGYQYTVTTVTIDTARFYATLPIHSLISVSFPEKLGGYPVTAIGNGAFSGCTIIGQIYLPNGLKSIGSSAFLDSSITYIEIPSTLQTIGGSAFSGCFNLHSVSIPASVTTIGSGAFSSTSISVYVDEGNQTYSSINGALYNKSATKMIYFPRDYRGGHKIPYGVRSIPAAMFSGCSGLTSITIPNSVTSIGDYAFRDCSGLTSITIPDSVTSIGDGAFDGCSALRSITIPSSVTSIGDYTFRDCSGLTSITIPNSVTNIGDYAFSGCSELTSITIPNSVTNIGDSAFSGCSGLVSIIIPVSVSKVGRRAFGDCSALVVAEIPQKLVIDSYYTSYDDVFPNTTTILRYSQFAVVTIKSSLGNPQPSGTICLPLYGSPRSFSCKISKQPILHTTRPTAYYFFNGWESTGMCSSSTSDIPGEFSVSGDCVIESKWALTSIAMNTSESLLAVFSDVGSGWNEYAPSRFCSSIVAANEMSSVRAFLPKAGILSFRWRISAGRGDYCKFYLDGVEKARITRSTDWEEVLLDIPAGEHTVRWSYERGSGSSTGEDAAFLDDVDWRPEVSLAVSSEFGTVTPEAGTHTLVYGDEVVVSAVAPEPENGTRRVCIGWTGTGSAPALGDRDSVSFTITNDTSIVWNWRTDYLTGVSVSGGSGDFGPQWIASGEMVEVALSPAAHLYEISLSGDTDGVTLDGTTLRFVADRPRQTTVVITEVKLSLAVESAQGVATPPIGRHSLSWGKAVSASVRDS